MSRILIVDDDQDIRTFVRTVLTDSGHEVMAAKEAFEARELLDTYNFDLALIDVNMPGKLGYKLIEELKRSIRFKYLPIALFTSRRDASDIKRAQTLGVSAYIVKPVKKEALLEKVGALLRTSSNRNAYDYDVEATDQRGGGKLSVQNESRIVKITDTGISIMTELGLKEEQMIQYACPLLSEIGISSTTFIVSNVRMQLEGDYLVQMVFKSLTPEEITTLKTWIHKQALRAA